MAYNYSIRKKKLSKITKKDFEEAIYLAYRGGITSVAPLGFSGDNIILFGTTKEENGVGRQSIVSIRNYGGDAELLITNSKGDFLFYGRFDHRIGIRKVCTRYWNIFIGLRDKIESEFTGKGKLEDMEIPKNVNLSEGFKMLKAYLNEKNKGL